MTGSGSAGDGRVVVVTGANRGIGLELVRRLALRGDTVVLGCRDLRRGEEAARSLSGRVLVRRLDVTDTVDTTGLETELRAEYGRLDVLVNNAGPQLDTWQRAADADLSSVCAALDVNILGAWELCQRMLGLLRTSGRGRIVNVSSGEGSLTNMGGGIPAYRLGKAGLNVLTRMLAAELRADGVLVNSVCPGWVATDPDGAGGRPIADGARSVLWAVDLPDSGPTGGFFRDGRPLPW